MLQVFRSLPVARQLYRDATLPSSARTYARDTLTLGWEDRVRPRGRRLSAGGLEFGIALPRGTILRAGDCLVLHDAAAIVVIVEREEPVFLVRPASPRDWARFAYHVGNSHQPVMITDEELVCPDVPGMEQVLQYHGIPFTRGARPFTPLGPDHIQLAHRHQP